MTNTLCNDPRYLQALVTWKNANEAEKEVKKIRLEAEQTLLNIVLPKTKGTHNYEGGLEITTSQKEIWNNDKIAVLYAQYMTGQLGITAFPFEPNWGPDTEAIKFIENNDEIFYKKYLEPILSTKYEKPVFSINDNKLKGVV